MRLFKKFFSFGSRKSKKRSADGSLQPVQDQLKPPQVEDTEAAVCRLLRSSSGRFATELSSGLSSLPPLPHPIDSVIPPPKSSSTSIGSISARSTYSVTIHGRTVHSRTEFPNAYPAMELTPERTLVRRRSKSVPITPRDRSRLLALRLDPSVASLLNHYDDEGQLNSDIFSNTPSPQKEGALQRRRTGSTLRQLLGQPSPELRNSSVEGDISWAERFLGETDGHSSVSSIGPRTPVDTHFTLPSIDDKVAFAAECDTPDADHPTFSSLEVELSASTDLAQVPKSPQGVAVTPQRASQVFGFLSDKKRIHESSASTSKLPQLKTNATYYRRFSAESPISDTKHSHVPLPRRSKTHILQPNSPASQRRFSDVQSSLLPPAAPIFLSPYPKQEPTPSQPVIFQHTGQSSHGPREPRLPSKIPSRQSSGRLSPHCSARDDSSSTTPQPASREASNTDSRCTSPRPSQIPKLRSASGSSDISTESKQDPTIHSPRRHTVQLQPTVQMKPLRETELATGVPSKDSDTLSRPPQAVTPVRPFGFHPHLLRSPSSPASSSELSPVAKQMMADMRQQRMHARQRERQAGRLGSGQSRIRY